MGEHRIWDRGWPFRTMAWSQHVRGVVHCENVRVWEEKGRSELVEEGVKVDVFVGGGGGSVGGAVVAPKFKPHCEL